MTGHRARVALLALALALLTAGVAGAAVPQGVAADSARPGAGGLAQQGSGGAPTGLGGAAPFATTDVDPDTIRLAVSLAADGSANWTVEYRVALTDANETAAFEDLQADVRANTSAYVSSFRERMVRTARTAENATNRSMRVENVDVDTSVESIQEFGTVTYRFRWTNFSSTTGDAMQAGDALAGFFLEENTRMTVSWPAELDPSTLSPEPDEESEGSATWFGPADFGPGGPAVVVGPSGGPPVWILCVSALVGLALAGGLWYVVNRDELGAADEGDEAADAAAAPTPDAELLSNEERVLKLLEERGGRVKQQEVAAAFEWTDAKTSQVVTSLREDDEIDVFRLGRENVLVLPGESDL